MDVGIRDNMQFLGSFSGLDFLQLFLLFVLVGSLAEGRGDVGVGPRGRGGGICSILPLAFSILLMPKKYSFILS